VVVELLRAQILVVDLRVDLRVHRLGADVAELHRAERGAQVLTDARPIADEIGFRLLRR
jgi:hypothetical protein